MLLACVFRGTVTQRGSGATGATVDASTGASNGMQTVASAGKAGVDPTLAELGIVVEVIDAVTEKPLPSVTGVPGTHDDTWLQVAEGQEVFVAVANGTTHGVLVQMTIDGQRTPGDTVAPPSTRAIIGFFDPKLVKHKAIKMHAVDSHRQNGASVNAGEGAGTICVNLYKDETPKRERFSDPETVHKHWDAGKDNYTSPASADGHSKETTCLRATKGGGVSWRAQTFSPEPFVRGNTLGACIFRYTDEFGFAIRKVPLPKAQAAGGPLPASHSSKKQHKTPREMPAQARPNKKAKPTTGAGQEVIDLTKA